jgi:hypothetical protein
MIKHRGRYNNINFYFKLKNLLNCFNGSLEQYMQRPPATWAVWIHRIHATGGANGPITMVVIFVVCLCCCGWTQDVTSSLYVKKWYKNNLKMRLTALLSDPPLHAPYLVNVAIC